MKSDNTTHSNTILFRTDASPTIGTGHLMRCMALAEICLEQGHKVLFAMSECPSPLKTRLANNDIETVMLDGNTGITELLTLVDRVAPAGIVIDGYTFDEQYRQALFRAAIPVLAMDDGNSQHALHAHIVVNSSPLASPSDYRTIAPDARLLLGPAYVPLRREFRHSNNAAQTAMPDGQHVLVTFGGSDPLKLTLPVMTALLDTLPEPVQFDVVIGGAAVENDAIERVYREHANRIRLHRNTTRMAELMRSSRIAIAAAGSTLWELAYLTIPTIAVVVADNQAVMLDSPLSQWFNTIDARNGVDAAVNRIQSASQSLYQNSEARNEQRAALDQINVGAKAATICQAFNERFQRAS
jgi:UDP-2,4-diacetamido-2,4,6-trideoxy-beta-L-altropyranose hydrolase